MNRKSKERQLFLSDRGVFSMKYTHVDQNHDYKRCKMPFIRTQPATIKYLVGTNKIQLQVGPT